MSNITTYVGATGVGLTSVISRIARKSLDEGKTVLTICSLISKGVEFHIGHRAARRSGEEVPPYITSVISNACRFSDQVFVLGRTQGIDQEQYVLATPTKSRAGHANSIVFRINEYD